MFDQSAALLVLGFGASAPSGNLRSRRTSRAFAEAGDLEMLVNNAGMVTQALPALEKPLIDIG